MDGEEQQLHHEDDSQMQMRDGNEDQDDFEPNGDGHEEYYQVDENG